MYSHFTHIYVRMFTFLHKKVDMKWWMCENQYPTQKWFFFFLIYSVKKKKKKRFHAKFMEVRVVHGESSK